MDMPRNDLYETIMPAPVATHLVENFHHLSEPGAAAGLLTVPRAGHLVAGPDYGVRRSRLQGHDVLYCLSGQGSVLVGDLTYPVVAGQFAWLPGHLINGHEADAGDPWTLLWLRLEGEAALTAWSRLLEGRHPVFDVKAGATMTSWFQKLFALMRMRPVDIALALNAVAAELLTIIEGEVKGNLATRLPSSIARLTAAIAARPALP